MHVFNTFNIVLQARWPHNRFWQWLLYAYDSNLL